jgi:LmbE family N-acetylglucosaminyl deacetylase
VGPENLKVINVPSVLSVFAHPDDIEFVAAGTMLLLAQRGWDLHYMNLCTGNCGSLELGAGELSRVRLAEAKASAKLLGAKFHGPICDDLELNYSTSLLRKVTAVVRAAKPRIVLTHSPSDYMEDHMFASRLAVTAAFSRCIPNFKSTPARKAFSDDVTVYHAMPHGLRDPLRKRVRAGLYVDTASVQETKRAALALHKSQQHWLATSQGDGVHDILEASAREVGKLSGRFEFAEGWRRHSHVGFSAQEEDPLREALGKLCVVDKRYERSLEIV